MGEESMCKSGSILISSLGFHISIIITSRNLRSKMFWRDPVKIVPDMKARE
jgi:hypothetical protein